MNQPPPSTPSRNDSTSSRCHRLGVFIRRLSLAFLGFTGAIVTLFSLSFLMEALSDGMKGTRITQLASVILPLAPIGPMNLLVPTMVGIGIYLRCGSKVSTGDAVWAFLAAVLMFGCLIGSLVTAYEHFLFMDGSNTTPPSAWQWAGNMMLLGASIAFVALGFLRRKRRRGFEFRD